MINKIIVLLSMALMASCVSVPKGIVPTLNTSLNYSNLDLWAAHPSKVDAADQIPEFLDQKPRILEDVDIFFIHPTTYTKKASPNGWNADTKNQKLNLQTDQSTIKYQASIFNQVGHVYAPRYRQAHIQSFFTKDKKSGRQALDNAYRDVINAFQYFLKHHHRDNRIIIAAHSQGTVHAKRLLQEFFDGKPLKEKLIVAYLVGMPIAQNTFERIPPCDRPADTGCFTSWRTFKQGYIPHHIPLGDSIVVTNPVSWNQKKELVSKGQHKGAILRNFDKPLSQQIEAQIVDGILWTNKPKFPWSFLFIRKNYHILDMNLFYVDIQENALLRSGHYSNTGE